MALIYSYLFSSTVNTTGHVVSTVTVSAPSALLVLTNPPNRVS